MIKKPATLGNKYTCTSCRCRYYDLNKEPPTCPTCGNVYVEVKVAAKPKRYASRQ